MTPDQIKAIQESFAKVAPISEEAAALFYGRLFEIAPEVKPMFRSDMTEQGRKLMATRSVLIALRRIEDAVSVNMPARQCTGRLRPTAIR